MKLFSTNPAKNYEKIGSVKISTLQEIKTKVKKAHLAKKLWKNLPLEKRLAYFKKLIKVYEKRGPEVAKLQTLEMGKPLKESLADIKFDLENIEKQIKLAQKYLQPEVLDKTTSSQNILYREPYGVAAVISPWNYPSANFFISCLQVLMAGNVVVFKHSEETPLTGKLLEEIMQEAGFPEGVFSEVYGDGRVGDLLTDQEINLIHFTGSSKVGQYLYKKAAGKFIPVLLEMGGSSPGIIFKDADLDLACANVFVERFANCGQICCALKRLIVHESIYDEVVNRLVTLVEALQIEDPLAETTTLGPLVAKRQQDLLISQVEDAKIKGAKIYTGGDVPTNLAGAYYLPTILGQVNLKMKVMTEEVFGPVLPIVSFKTDQEAIEIANNTAYGLSAYLYGKNLTHLKEIASQIEAGQISLNAASYFSPNSPFGGYKLSGMGRNDGQFGFESVTQKKVVAEPIN